MNLESGTLLIKIQQKIAMN